ncbi:hypothetical protein DYB30_009601 [Aphanomyces astaci]|uniref:Uncharacterized protein n=1 Tax=Aphanomyces astaci TaxID=112090 RepID=A0A397CU81_APHAT|nr:hypothetical protein DYB30_009601 [Aphanomyces astaci]
MVDNVHLTQEPQLKKLGAEVGDEGGLLGLFMGEKSHRLLLSMQFILHSMQVMVPRTTLGHELHLQVHTMYFPTHLGSLKLPHLPLQVPAPRLSIVVLGLHPYVLVVVHDDSVAECS